MPSSPCLFVKQKEDSISLVSMYVDDGGVATVDEEERKQLMKFLCERFQMKDLGVMKISLAWKFRKGRCQTLFNYIREDTLKGYYSSMECRTASQSAPP